MTEPKSERRAPATWELRLFEAIPLAPPWVGLLLGASTYAIYLLFTALVGSEIGVLPGLGIENAWASEIILCLLVGIAPTVTVYTLRGAVRDLYDLRPVLGCSDEEYAELRRRITAIRPGVLEVVGLTVGISAAYQIATDPSVWAGGKSPPLGDPTLMWIALRNGLNLYMLARAIYIEITLARAFSTLANHIGTISLLDSAPLAPFGRRGLRSVGFWMLVTLFYSLLYVGNWAADVLPLVLVSFLIFAFAAFLLPVLGAHRRIRQARAAELGRVRVAIQTTRDAVLVAVPLETPGGRLADLVAYEGRIAAVRAWPFDTPTLLRFTFYVALGLASWFGAALVERLLDSVLR